MAETKKRKTTTSTRAKTNTGKRGRPPKRKEPEQPEFLQSEVAIIISFALAVLLFLSNFHLCGVFGDFLRSVQLGIFGSVGFIAPLLLFVGTCFYIANRENPRAMMKMGAVICAILVLCAFAQLIFGIPLEEGGKITACYQASSKSGAGGGIVGGAIAAGLTGLLGTVGSYLVLAVLFAICTVLITEKSLVSFVKSGGSKACQYAKEDFDRRKEIHAERQEERRRIREENRVRGVNLDATALDAGGYPDGDYEYDDDYNDDYDEALDLEPGDELGSLNDRLEGKKEVQRSSFRRSSREEFKRAPASGNLAAHGDGTSGGTRTDQADVFTGKITPPAEFDEDTVPFDADELEEVRTAVSKTEEPVKHDEDQAADRPKEERRDDPETYEEEEAPWEIQPEEVHVTMAHPDFDDMISPDELLSIRSIPAEPPEKGLNETKEFTAEEGTRRVVTAGGKIIETDTEMLRKKVEKKRETAAEEDRESVEHQIADKVKEIEKKEYIFPTLDLLKKGSRNSAFSDREYKETAIKLQQTLKNFGVGVTVTNISCGPSVTRYELHPEQGVKVSKIVGLTDDIKLSLAAADIRIEAPIPGKAAVGIEVPNKENSIVLLRDLLESDNFKKHPSRLAFAVGKDIGGQVVVTDIAKMPHLLIAGATGSGKSVCINTLIMSIIFKSKPEDVKLIMIDPKVVELSVYNGIPHLLIPVVTDPKKASGALNWAVAEMTDRYKKFADYNVRDLKGYNDKIKNIEDIDDENKPKKLPQIIIIIDELADLMMVAPGEVEDSICRLAQLARAAGIHLVIATQRPSVNVITGLIKANVPSRIAFAVSSGVDSRTIIDMNGAEKLLGKGDMLFYPSGYPKPQRVQGAFVSDSEVQNVVDFLKDQGMTAEYSSEVESSIAAPGVPGPEKAGNRDEYFVQAGKFIIEKEKASIGMLQRMYKIGFNRAARIMDQLAEAGVVGEEEGTKPRKVLMTMEEFDEMIQNGL
ncbi:DNA translocase FtsK [Clostridium sp. AM58-1XD]|uniref:FtsK/SpoIIIE family DNA translocase n=1 Tax=Clostridium sp. AM58-1XD TaxID=2292307 RepID=UPI000E4BA555|nr:DNA translocase FtsK [Clostridium sp. AM58-1XD]RGY99433.1 DNA translocase FtsK [Clostridium sp. AM58-1XD]